MSYRTRLLLLLVALAPLAADWPRFRGPNGTGHADADKLPTSWDDNTNVVWKVPVPGKGSGSPIVVGGKVFLQTASADANERTLLAFDLATGKRLWERAIPGGRGKTHVKNTLATSTPAADAERVYLLAWDGEAVTLHAFGHDGDPKWQQPVGPFSSQHGAAGSPMLAGDLVIVNDDQDDSATLRAFHAATGKPAWNTKRKAYRASYSTPLLRETPKGPELVVSSTAGVAGYDPATGSERWAWAWDWSYTKEPLRVVGSPILAKGLVVTSGGNGGGNSHIVAIDPNTGKLAWEKKKGFPYVPSLLSQGDYLLTVGDRGVAGCYDAKTGKELWSERLGGAFSASPVIAGGAVYAINEDGTAFVFAAGPAYKKLGGARFGEGVMASPAVADGRLVVRTAGSLVCVGKK